MAELHRPGIAILASGSGSTAEAFIHATQDGRVAAEVGLIVCNNPPEKAGVYARIARLNKQYGLTIEMAEISGRTHPKHNVGSGQTLTESEAICRRVRDGGFAHVACMGYMKQIRGDLLEEYGYWKDVYDSIYQAKMSNTHPGPLPQTANTYGLNTSARVLELGLAASKHTVHLIADRIDTGPIIAQHPVEVRPEDSAQALFDRVQTVEKATLPYVLDQFLREQEAYRNGNS